MTRAPAVAGRRAPSWLKILNMVTKPLLRRGLSPGPQFLLMVRGRRTGLLRSTPVAVLDHAGAKYLVAGFDRGDWVANVRSAGRAVLARGSRRDEVILEEIPIGERAPILRAFTRVVRGGRAFVAVAPDASDAEFASASPRHPVFRIRSAAR